MPARAAGAYKSPQGDLVLKQNFPLHLPDEEPATEFAARAKAAWGRLIRMVYEADPPECPLFQGPTRFVAVSWGHTIFFVRMDPLIASVTSREQLAEFRRLAMKDACYRVRHAMLGLLLGAGLGAAATVSDGANHVQDAAKAQAPAERRQKMIEQCMLNRGTREDCAKQVDTELAAQGVDRQQSQGEGGRGGRR